MPLAIFRQANTEHATAIKFSLWRKIVPPITEGEAPRNRKTCVPQMNTKRLTILQIVPALESGGVERGILEIGGYLASHGHRSVVISNGGRMERQLTEEGSEHIKAAIGAKSPLSLRYIPWLRRILLDLKPDIVHV